MMNEAIPTLEAFDEASLDKAFAALENRARVDATFISNDADVERFRLEWL